MRVSEAHQLKDGSHTTASDPQFGKSVKDMPRYSSIVTASHKSFDLDLVLMASDFPQLV